ncbi:MAG: hypothetical protein KDA90_09570, partial [Planctomycetaceae bacterium]|nr:hypothetical protein [Planctomycetaceae bacterium]
MFRIFGLLMCGGLVAASAWLARQTHAQAPAGDEANPFAQFRQQSQSATGQTSPAANPFGPTPSAGTDSFGAVSGNEAGLADPNRVRVQDLMRQARAKQQAGQREEALRLASIAARTAAAWQVTLGPNEQTPAQLVAQLQGSAPQRPATEMFAQQAPTAIPSQVPETLAERRDYAQKVLSAARKDIQQGHLAEAQGKVQHVQQLDLTYDVFDLRPEQVMVELARAMPANPNGPSDNLAQLNAPVPASATQVQAQPQAPSASQDAKTRSRSLVQQARQAMQQGHLTEARELALEAQKIDTTWTLLDDRPEHVLADIGRLSGTEILVAHKQTADATPTAEPRREDVLREQALAELRAARKLMAAGQFDAAREKALAVRREEVAYGLFDDRPELVLQELQTAQNQAMVAGGLVASSTPPAAEPNSPEAQKAAALNLLHQARNAMQQGQLEAAVAKLEQAQKYDVVYDLFEETPERIREDLSRAIAEARSGQGNQVASNAAPFAGNVANAGGVMQADVRQQDSVVSTAGGSASEMFNQGVAQLRQGNREGAYAAFLAAYNSGERLDPFRQQQLQDKLRELAPRRGAIQQVSNEVAGQPRGLLPAPNGQVMDSAIQEQAVKFERLRVETLQAMTKAEQLREKKPEQALEVVDQTLESIASSDLGEERTGALTASLRSTRSSIERYMHQKAPIFEMERKNAEVKDLIERDLQTRLKIEQDLAELVDKYNTLMDQKRFAEAHSIAKQAKELDPTNPVVVNMDLKSQFALRNDQVDRLRSDKESAIWQQLHDVETSAFSPVSDAHPMVFSSNWAELKERRKAAPTDAREHSETELRVRRSLLNPVSLHFETVPLAQVMQHIADTQGINVVVDEAGLTEEGISATTPVSIGVDGIQLRSALNLLLHPLNLDYTIENEVLNITSRLRQQGELKTAVYQVADLVVPVSVRAPTSVFQQGSGFNLGGTSVPINQSIPAYPALGGGLAQIPANGNPLAASIPALNGRAASLQGPAASDFEFEALSELITTTIAPQSWDEIGGQGSVNSHESTLSLVIRQTQKVHQEIADLLDQLRRLQDVQVTIEVRYITVSDQFFEQIGIDFDFNVQDTVGGPTVDNEFNPIRPFGSTDPTNGAAGGAGTSGGTTGAAGGGGTAGTAGAAGGGNSALAPFSPQPSLNRIGRDNWANGTVVGLINNNQILSPEL